MYSEHEIMSQKTPFKLLGGEPGVKALVEAFYDRMETLPEVKDIRNMHGHDLSGIRQKLFEYLCGWLGGPNHYLEKYGNMCMTSPHKGYAIGEKERDQWLLCMEKALEDIQASDELKKMLELPMFRIADAIKNQ